MRILILGGTRFIGPPVVRLLDQHGHDIALFHRRKTSAELPAGVQHILGDRSRLIDYSDAFIRFAPDVVLDMIAFTAPDSVATLNAFTGVARRIVAVSSCDVYRAYDRLRGADPGPADPTPLTEDSPLRDRLFPYRSPETKPDEWVYSYDKILMERAVLSAQDRLPATVLRLPMVYGPGDNQHRLFEYIKRIDDGRPLILLPEDAQGLRAPRGYVDDIAYAIALCIESNRAAGRIYHVGEEPTMTEMEWLQRIAASTGWTGRIDALPNANLPESMRHNLDPSQDWSLDTSRIRTELGYSEPTDPTDAIRRTIAWERANPKDFTPDEFDYAAEDFVAAQPA